MLVTSSLVGGCADRASTDDVESTGEFLSSPEDEIVDPEDPPDTPDPDVDDGSDDAPQPSNTVTSALSTKKKRKKHRKGGTPDNGGMGCGTANALSPAGLSLVIHVSKDDANAERLVRHLTDMKSFVRQRDVFMIDHGSPAVAQLRALFPCNRFHEFVREPNQLADTLATAGDGVEAIAVDWELAEIRTQSQGWSTSRLADFSAKIHANGKKAAFIPFWYGRRFDDRAVQRGSNMQYELTQIQTACLHGAAAFGDAVKATVRQYGAGGVRNVGFEISMDSYGSADANVSAERAAACTERAYRKGARAIYVYGNGPDQMPEYLHALAKLAVRGP